MEDSFCANGSRKLLKTWSVQGNIKTLNQRKRPKNQWCEEVSLLSIPKEWLKNCLSMDTYVRNIYCNRGLFTPAGQWNTNI